MEKRCVFWSRFWFCRFSAFFLALLILCTSAINVDASSASTRSFSIVYKNSPLDDGDFNTLLNTEIDSMPDLDNSLMLGYHFGQSYNIFTPAENVYAYKISVKPSNVAMTKKQVYWVRPYVGTYNDSVNGTANIGKELYNGATSQSDIYILTDGSTEPIYLSLLIKFYIKGISEGSIDITSGSLSVTYTPCSRSAYENALLEQEQLQTEELQNQTQEMEEQTQELEEQTQELEEQTETQKGIFNSIKDFFGSFFQNLIDSVIGLFVPDKEELSSIFSRFDEFFSNKFGFLYFPFEVLGKFLNLFGSAPSAPQLTLPGFSIMGHQVWDRQTYNLLDNSLMLEISNYVRMGTSAILIFAFINYCGNKFKGVVNK